MKSSSIRRSRCRSLQDYAGPYVFQRLLADAFHFVQLVNCLERAVGITIIDNSLRQHFANPGQRVQLLDIGSVDIDNHFAGVLGCDRNRSGCGSWLCCLRRAPACLLRLLLAAEPALARTRVNLRSIVPGAVRRVIDSLAAFLVDVALDAAMGRD